MRRKIFLRILALLAALLGASSALLALFELRENRRLHQQYALEKLLILTRGIEPLLLWNDRVAIQRALLDVQDSKNGIRYAFVERQGYVVAHTFAAGVPAGLVGVQGAASAPLVRELRDQDGRTFHDLALAVATDGAVVHVALDRHAVDREALPALVGLLVATTLVLLALIYPAWWVAGSITTEVTAITARLAETNQALEARVRDRTADLIAVNTRLDEEREKLAVTLRSIGDGVITADVAGRVVLLNRAAEELTGWKTDEAAGRPLAEVLHLVDRESREGIATPLAEVLRTDAILGLPRHTVLLAKGGTERIIADSIAPIHDKDSRTIGVVLVFRDVTEKERLEVELQRTEKLESIGALAAGIAHDFNNVLTAILGNINLAALQVEGSDPVSLDLKHAEEATLRARDLSVRLLTFAKGNAPVKEARSIESIVRNTADLAMSGSKARCVFDFQPGLPAVDVDAGQIGQVVHNLLINADQAMPLGGEIIIRGQTVLADNQPGLPLVPGLYVRVTVEDHGSGIAEDQLLKIFDPFFTTKPKGTGLGLAVVHSIVKNHGGHVAVVSRVGQGTTFSLYLPTTAEVPAPQRLVAPTVGSGIGRVLVMDDEEMIREVLGRMLARMGYAPEAAAHGEEALAKCAKGKDGDGGFVLLILDLTIPGGMGGRETLARLRRAGVDAPAIASSGYASDPIMSDPAAYGFIAAIPKPYDISELCRVIRESIATGRAERGGREAET